MKTMIIVNITAAALLVGGCQSSNPGKSDETASQASSAPPVEVPAVSGSPYPLSPGDERQIRRLRNGEEITIATRMLDDGTLQMTRSNGCNSTMSSSDRYGPRLSWSNCRPGPWGSATNHITHQEGRLWPFNVGNKVSYKYDSTNSNGRVFKGYRNCEVVGTAMAQANGKQYPAYRIDCKTHYGKQRYYYSPQIETTARFEQDHNRRGRLVVEYLDAL